MTKESLEVLINDFSIIKSEKPSHDFCYSTYHEIRDYYNKIYQEMKTQYMIKDIEEFARNPKTYEKLKHSSKLGIFISAAINKNIQEGERVFINSPIPIDLLFYNLKGSEAHTDKAGDRLGYCAENSRIYANEAGDYAGSDIVNSELHIISAGNSLGEYAKNSKIYAEKAGDDAGSYIDNSELHITIAEDYLGSGAENSRIYAGNAGAWAGYYLKNSELRVVSALDYLGYGAKNSTVYAEKMKVQYNKESYDQVKNLRLCIGTLEGKLKHKLNFLKGLAGEGNEICLSKQTYNKHRILYKMTGAKIWEI
ncbi:MAG: hypothetical protein ACP5MV_03970 [Candidatus Parvarchaeum sp.]